MRLHKRSLLRAFAAGIALCVAFGTAACSGGSTSQENDASADSETPTEQITPIEVVASVNQWGSLAEQIGGVHVKVTSVLSSTDVNAHDFEPKTDDIDKLQQAQVVVSNGAGYDTWATKNLSKTMVSVSAAQMVGAVEGDNPHLWFSSDARNAMAKELADTYSRIMPAQKKYFNNKLTAWNRREKKIEKDMKAFSDSHKNVSYAATEPVAYYLLSDMGFTDNTPEGYLQSSSTNSEPAPTDLQEFQELLEKHKVEVLINDTQSTSDATNTLTGIAYKSDVPVLDVSEQMPSDYTSLTSWIRALIPSSTRWIQAMAVKTPRTAIPRTATRIPMIPAPKAPPRMMPMRKTPRPAPVPARTPSTSVSARRPHPVTHLRIRQRPMPPMAIPAMPPATTRPTPANS